MLSRNVGLFGFNLYFLADKSEYLREVFGKIVKWYDRGIIRPVIGARYSFDRIVEAQTFLQSRKSIGKVVVTL
jgi:NADPH:quinone reductase-like Zn-dependent oxidoreductase